MAKSNLFTNEVNVELDVFRTLMLNRIAGQVHCRYVVGVHNRGPRQRTMKLQEEVPQPGTLRYNISDPAILSFSTGSRNNRLSFGRPRDQSVVEENTVAQGGSTSVRAPSPISISICNKITLRRRRNGNTKRHCTMDISDDSLEGMKVRFPGIMHE